jgi:hypothetical protein
MERLTERAIELLGKSISGSHFREFLEEYCPLKRPVWDQLSPGLVRFCITDLGLSIWSDHNEIFQVFFHVVPFELENDLSSGKYTSQLPLNVSLGDRRSDVHTKVGVPELSLLIDSSNISETYNLGTVNFVFWYELPNEIITEVRVGRLSITP